MNSGLTVGFQTGMKYALQFDAGGQHRPEYIAQMLEVAEREGADIAIGSRFLNVRKVMSARMIGSRLISVMD